jgi:hypothetical protein
MHHASCLMRHATVFMHHASCGRHPHLVIYAASCVMRPPLPIWVATCVMHHTSTSGIICGAMCHASCFMWNGYASCIVGRAPCIRSHAASCVMHPRLVPHAVLCVIRHASCVMHSLIPMRAVSSIIQHVSCYMRHASRVRFCRCVRRHDSCKSTSADACIITHHATCFRRHASCVMRQASCVMCAHLMMHQFHASCLVHPLTAVC